jgi:hypothetical protein
MLGVGDAVAEGVGVSVLTHASFIIERVKVCDRSIKDGLLRRLRGHVLCED